MKKICGVSKARWDQMMELYNDERDTVAEIIDECGAEVAERGWDIATCDFGGGFEALEIERVDDIGAFDDDDEATAAAIAAGVRVIPVEELPENFDHRYLGWIDTPENRDAINRYCEVLLR